jgi:hypothetical protein
MHVELFDAHVCASRSSLQHDQLHPALSVKLEAMCSRTHFIVIDADFNAPTAIGTIAGIGRALHPVNPRRSVTHVVVVGGTRRRPAQQHALRSDPHLQRQPRRRFRTRCWNAPVRSGRVAPGVDHPRAPTRGKARLVARDERVGDDEHGRERRLSSRTPDGLHTRGEATEIDVRPHADV